MINSDSCDFSDKFLASLLRGDRLGCSAIAKQFLANKPSFLDLYEEVIRVSLYEVGRLWEKNQISVANEHIATAITEGILNELFEEIISKKRINRKVIVACVENEHHQIGVKMVADTFEMLGWESFFLGTGIPVLELIRYIHEVKPDLIAISLSIYFNFANLIKMIEKIKSEFPEIQILVGGQAFNHLPADAIANIGNVVLLSDLYILKVYIEAINTAANTKENGTK